MEVPLESQTGVMAIEVPQNEEISGGGKNGGREGIGSAIRWEERIGGNRGLHNHSRDQAKKEWK